jgi:hypothetical protein
MRTDQFLRLLTTSCGLQPSSRRAAKALGLSLRQLQRITAGKAPVPAPVALLLIAYSKFGLPDPLWDPDRDKIDVLSNATQALQALLQQSRTQRAIDLSRRHSLR